LSPAPRVDAHQLFWDPARFDYPRLATDLAPLRRTFGPADLRPDLAREGITATVLVQALPSVAETRHLLSMAAGEDFVAGVVGWVDLGVTDVDRQLEELRSAPGGEYLVGLRHAACAEPDPEWLLSDEVRRGLAAVESAGLAFDLHICTRELPAARSAGQDHPGLRFVIDHLAAPPIASGDLSAWGRAILPLAALPNVSAKISGLVTEADWHTWSIDDLRHPVELAVDVFGPGRLMLGSDWPHCLLAGSYSDALDSCRYLLAELPAHDQDAIRGGTAMRAYRLSTHTA
jgi:L-fuconolactonase